MHCVQKYNNKTVIAFIGFKISSFQICELPALIVLTENTYLTDNLYVRL